MKTLLQLAAILLLAAIAAVITWSVTDDPPKESACDPKTIKEGEICLQSIPTDKEVLWIDARSRSEWEQNGLVGSILWNFDQSEDFKQLEREAVEKIFSTPYVVIYCNDKGCGTSHKLASHIMDTLKIEAEVHVLHNGWKALEAAGRITS